MMIFTKANTPHKNPFPPKGGEGDLAPMPPGGREGDLPPIPPSGREGDLAPIPPGGHEGDLPLWIFYIIGFLIVFALKLFNSKAGCSDLLWILGPTEWWVRFLSGISFEYEPEVGYINHHFRFVIASSCSGVQFMLITIATLIFSFVHRIRTNKRRFYWLGLSILVSYVFTILVNGLRIVLSIYLPAYIEKTGGGSGLITPERLHTMIGVAVYFTSLCVIYRIAEHTLMNVSHNASQNASSNVIQGFLQILPNNVEKGGLPHAKVLKQALFKCLVPLFWYFFIALGIPFLNKAYFKDSGNFVEYAVLMTAVCLIIIVLFCLISIFRKRFNKEFL